MGIYHLFQNYAKGKTPKDFLLTRFLQTIALYPNDSIVQKPSKQIFTSDSLSRMARQQLQAEENDRTILPTLFVAPAILNRLSRQLIKHLRHQQETRLAFTSKGIMAKYGHSKNGSLPSPDLYDGPPLRLYHITTLQCLSSIRTYGLSLMNRWYIHFSSISPPQLYDSHIYQRALRKGEPLIFAIDTQTLRTHNINVYRTASMNTFIVSQSIPFNLLIRLS